MEKEVKILDRTFVPFIKEEEIHKRVKQLAEKLNEDLKDSNPIFLAVLSGSFIFAADLVREITIPSQITFVKVSSYRGTQSTGEVREEVSVSENLEGRTIVIVEDIVDSGTTMKHMVELLKTKHPKEIRICSLLVKPGNLRVPLNIDYYAFSIPNDFIVGYGLDYDHQGRNLRDIYVVKD